MLPMIAAMGARASCSQCLAAYSDYDTASIRHVHCYVTLAMRWDRTEASSSARHLLVERRFDFVAALLQSKPSHCDDLTVTQFLQGVASDIIPGDVDIAQVCRHFFGRVPDLHELNASFTSNAWPSDVQDTYRKKLDHAEKSLFGETRTQAISLVDMCVVYKRWGVLHQLLRLGASSSRHAVVLAARVGEIDDELFALLFAAVAPIIVS